MKQIIKNKIEERQLYKFPLFISYPRSGVNWANCVMELYFDRPRLRKSRITFLDKSRRDWMWIHDHDLDFKLINNLDKQLDNQKILFLHRDPVNVIFSYIKFNGGNFSEKNVKENIKSWIDYHLEYFRRRDNVKIIRIRFEDLRDFEKAKTDFKKICEYFGQDFDKDKLQRIILKYGPVNIDTNGKQYSKQYKKNKKEFIRKWGNHIKLQVYHAGLGELL